MKTTADALRWALNEISSSKIKIIGDLPIEFAMDFERNLQRAKEILALSEFVESDVAPDYSKDSGFDMLIDTTPAAYAIPEQQ